MAKAHKRPEVEAPASDRPSATTTPPERSEAELRGQSPDRGATAQHSTGNHVFIGDSVDGASIDVHGVVFSPGELAALVDYVGDLENLQTFEPDQLLEMQRLLREGVTDSAAWYEATDGLYAELSKANEDHFAPGGGQADFRSAFLQNYTSALESAKEAQADEANADAHMENARLALYTAEHFLQDAFSSGHQVAASDIERSVNLVLDDTRFELFYPGICAEVFARSGDVIARYAYLKPDLTPPGIRYDPIDTLAEWMPLALTGVTTQGRGGLYDGVRKSIHEALAETGVEVTSQAHPEAWLLTGDEDLEGVNPESIAAMQAALLDARQTLELAVTPTTDAPATAAELFDRHCPRPTEAGKATIDGLLQRATASPMALAVTIADATSRTISEIMDFLVFESHGALIRLDDPAVGPEPELPGPELPEPEAPEHDEPARDPEPPRSYVPQRGSYVPW